MSSKILGRHFETKSLVLINFSPFILFDPRKQTPKLGLIRVRGFIEYEFIGKNT